MKTRTRRKTWLTPVLSFCTAILGLSAWADTLSGLSNWQYNSVVVWRTASIDTSITDFAFAKFAPVTDIDSSGEGTIGTVYTQGTSSTDTHWRRWASKFQSGDNSTYYTAPGLVLVYDTAGLMATPAKGATFGPVSFGGMWVKELGANSTPYGLTDEANKGRATEFGATGCTTYFVFDASYTIYRGSTTTFNGVANVAINNSSTFTSSTGAATAISAGSTLILTGNGTLNVGTGLTIAGTLDMSSATVPTISGNVTLASGATIVLPSGTSLDSPDFTVCSGTLTVNGGLANIKIGDTTYENAIVTTDGGKITAISTSDYAVTITEGDVAWADASWAPSVPTGDLTDKEILVTISSGATLSLPESVQGATIRVTGGGCLTNDTSDVTTLTDVTLVGAVGIAGTVKTTGTTSFDITGGFWLNSTLEVASGTLYLATGDQVMQGNITIDADATLNAKSTDSIWYYDHNATIAIYGTLDMGTARWSLRSTDYHFVFITYPGAEVKGTGDGNAAIDIISGGTFNISAPLIQTSAEDPGTGGTVTFSAPIRANDKIQFAVASGVTVDCSSTITFRSAKEFNLTNTGTLVLSGSISNSGARNVSNGGTLIYAGVNDSTASSINVKNNGKVILRGGTADSPFYFAGNVAITSGSFYVEEGSYVKIPAWITNLTVPSGAYVTIIEALGMDGTAKVTLGDGATVADNVTLLRADGSTAITDATASAETGTITLTFAPSTSGQICWLDFEFDNESVASSGATPYALSGGKIFYTDDDEQGIMINTSSCPYSSTDIGYPTEWSAAIRCTVPDTANAVVVAFGSMQTSTKGIIGLAMGESEGTVNIVSCASDTNKYEVVAPITVASPATSMHLYVFTKTANTITVYCDGSLVRQKTFDETITVPNAFQVGSVHGGMKSSELVAAPSTSTAKMDFMRLYYGAIGPNMIAQLSEEYPYTSTADTYTRTVSGAADWVSSEAWSSNGVENVSEPASSAIATLTASEETAVTVNLTSQPAYEQLTLAGGAMTFTAGDEAAKLSAAKLIVSNATTVAYDAVDFSGTVVELGESGSLTFDFSDYPFIETVADTTIPLTGTSASGLAVSVKATGYTDRISVSYNADGYYEATITARDAATVYWAPSAGAQTLTDTTEVFDKFINLAGNYYAMGNTTYVREGDTLIIVGPSSLSQITLANTGKLDAIQVIKGKVEFVNAIADYSDALILGGEVTAIPYSNDAYGDAESITLDSSAVSVQMDYAPGGATLTVSTGWAGIFIVNWDWGTEKAPIVLDNYGISGSTVQLESEATNCYLKATGDGTVPSIAPNVIVNNTLTFTDGYSDATAWGNLTTFTKLSGSSSAVITGTTPSNSAKTMYYAVTTLSDYLGSFVMPTRAAIKFGSVVLTEEPEDGVYVKFSGAGTAANLKTTPVTAGETTFTGLALDSTAGGLVKALAAIDDTTYATISAAVATAKSTDTIELLNYVDGTTELPDGYKAVYDSTTEVWTLEAIVYVKLTIGTLPDGVQISKVEQTLDGVTTTLTADDSGAYSVVSGASATITYAAETGYYLGETTTQTTDALTEATALTVSSDVTATKYPWLANGTYYKTLQAAADAVEGSTYISQQVDTCDDDVTIGSEETLKLLLGSGQTLSGDITLNDGGKLAFDGSYNSGAVLSGKLTITGEGNVIEAPVIAPHTGSFEGSGSVTVNCPYANKGLRLNGTLSSFTGTVTFNVAADSSTTAFGLTNGGTFGTGAKVVVTTEATEAIATIAIEKNLSVDAVEFKENANVRGKYSCTLTIAGSDDSTLNSALASLNVAKTGDGTLTLGESFSSDSSITISGGSLEVLGYTEGNSAGQNLRSASVSFASGASIEMPDTDADIIVLFEAKTISGAANLSIDGWKVSTPGRGTDSTEYYALKLERNAVAQIGTTTYTSLAKAIAAATSGDTIQLLADVDVSDEGVAFPASTTLTLDLNNCTLTAANTAAGHIQVNGALTITDTSTEAGGKIVSSTSGTYGVVQVAERDVSGASLTIAGGAIEAYFADETDSDGQHPAYGVVVKGTGTAFTMTGGSIKAGYMALMGHGSKASGGAYNISGGTITSMSDFAAYFPTKNGCEVTISGGTFSGLGGVGVRAGTISVTGGIFTATGTGITPGAKAGTTGLYFSALSVWPNYGAVAVTVSGGTFTSTTGVGAVISTSSTYTGTISLTGGTYSTDVSDYCASGYQCSASGDAYVVTEKGGLDPSETDTMEVEGAATDDADEIAASVEITVPTAVSSAMTIGQTVYAAYFTKTATWNETTEKWDVTVALADAVTELADTNALTALDSATAGAQLGEITVKPGLYYGAANGSDITALKATAGVLNTTGKLDLSGITKPTSGSAFFIKIKVGASAFAAE